MSDAVEHNRVWSKSRRHSVPAGTWVEISPGVQIKITMGPIGAGSIDGNHDVEIQNLSCSCLKGEVR